METHIANITAAQDEDEYISTQIQLTDKERWTGLHDHEFYNMGHLLTVAAPHHRVTGSDTFLAMARNLATICIRVLQLWPTSGSTPG